MARRGEPGGRRRRARDGAGGLLDRADGRIALGRLDPAQGRRGRLLRDHLDGRRDPRRRPRAPRPDGGRGRHDAAGVLRPAVDSLRAPGGYDPHARIADMDADGIDAAVLYPSQAMFFGPTDPIPALHDIDFVDRLHPRVQRVDRRVLRRVPDAACSASPECRCRTSTGPIAEAQRAVGELGLRGGLPPPVGIPVRGRTAPSCRSTTPPTTRSGRRCARSSACRSRSTPASTSTRPARAAKFESRRPSREHVGDEHGDGRAARRLRPRPGGRQRRRHDRHARPPAHGRRVRALPRPQASCSSSRAAGGSRRQLERMDEQVKAFPLETPLAVAAAERVLQAPVLRRLRARGVEPRRVRRVPRRRPHPLGSDYPHPEYHEGIVDELRRAASSALDGAAGERILGAQRGRRLQPARSETARCRC